MIYKVYLLLNYSIIVIQIENYYKDTYFNIIIILNYNEITYFINFNNYYERCLNSIYKELRFTE